MKLIPFQPLATLMGAMAAVLVLTLCGAQVQDSADRLDVGETRVAGIPAPRDMVRIKEGTPFVVPEGKLFVLTALGSSTGAGSASLRVDGVYECTASAATQPGGSQSGGIGNGTTMKALPPGHTTAAGATIEVTGGSAAPDDARAWGYLAEP